MSKVDPLLPLHNGTELRSSSQFESLSSTTTISEDIKVKREAIRQAFDENMKNRPVKHDEGHVLLLSWEELLDDLEVKPEVERLESVFMEDYGFHVTWEKLGSQRPTHDLNHYLSKFIWEHGHKNALLIIYYAGHGVYANNSIQWQPTRQRLSKEEQEKIRVVWKRSEHLIEDSPADILVIFDCCEAGSVGGIKSRAPRPNFEYIAACSEDGLTCKPGEESFTSALIWSLKELCPSAPFTSSVLVEKTKKYPHLPKDQDPQLRKREESSGFVWIAPIGIDPSPNALANSVHRNPDHEFLDLRLDYYQKLKVEDVEYLARKLSVLVNHDERFAKQITLTNISSDHDTISRFVDVWRTNGKRKSISSPSEPRPDDNEMILRPAKRQRTKLTREVIETQHLVVRSEAKGAIWHLQMFTGCTLRNVSWGLGRLADRIRPRPRGPRIVDRVETVNRLEITR